MKEFKYVVIPIKNGKWLTDSKGKVRIYKSAESAYRNVKNYNYDKVIFYVLDDEVSKEEFENLMEGGEQ